MKDDSNIGVNRQFAYKVLLSTGIVLGMLLLLLGLWYAVQVLLLTFAGVLLAIILRIPATWLAERTRFSESWSVGIVVFSIILLFIGIGTMVAPQVTAQINQLQEQLPLAIEEFQKWLKQHGFGQWLMNELFVNTDLGRELQTGAKQAAGVASTLAGVVSGIFILFFVAIFLAVNPKLYINGILHMFPFAARQRAAQVLGVTGYTLHRWLLGALINMTAIGIMTFIGLWLLDMPLAFLLAFLAFLLDFVPYFGPIISSIPAIFIGFAQGPEQALYVLLLYLGVQQLQGLLMDPLVYGKTVYLPPVLTILSQVLLYAMAGSLGVILATPLMAVVFMLVKMVYVEQTLGDDSVNDMQKAATESGYVTPLPPEKG